MSTYITGDTHGDFSRFSPFCSRFHTSFEDTMIVLGDAGLNYGADMRDYIRKSEVSKLPLTFFCIHGNHERRPHTIPSYKLKQFHGGQVWYEPEFPQLLFAKDGEVYSFEGHECIVIGGAYSVDKEYRLLRGWHWFADEQPSEEIKERVESVLRDRDYKIDTVLSHTCPLGYEPVEMFLDGLDQSQVDKSTEEWLGRIEERLEYRKWYCGHFHTDKKVDRLRFLFTDIELLG